MHSPARIDMLKEDRQHFQKTSFTDNCFNVQTRKKGQTRKSFYIDLAVMTTYSYTGKPYSRILRRLLQGSNLQDWTDLPYLFTAETDIKWG